MENIKDEKYIRSSEFLNLLSQELNRELKNHALAVCFSQNKDELVLGFANQASDFYIVADLQAETGFLHFPNEFHRARKNSADIFPDIIDKKIVDVCTHWGDRSFHFELEGDFQLVFKMHGRNANVILLQNNLVISVFKNSLENDFEFQIPKSKNEVEANSYSQTDEANQFYAHFSKTYYLQREKEQIRKYLTERIKKTANYIAKSKKELDLFLESSDYEQTANIIMANLHLKIENEKAFTFFDFYANQDISIKLKPEISLQKNAENYYRKSKNRKIELNKLQENLHQKQLILSTLEVQLADLQAIVDIKAIRQFAKINKINIEASLQSQPAFPFRTFECQGFHIWVGKSAENNDLLTLKHAFKEDLWLHAKDVSGSHVVIKYQSGKHFPKNVIEKAAELAAFYSKRKSDSLVPVTVTPKKYVRKPKGFAAGKVIVEKEEVVLVQPKDHKN
ncbi:MAG: NFACT RNA binding domain-containing protein [Cytophagales bacterium]